jgi:hypothetical protein
MSGGLLATRSIVQLHSYFVSMRQFERRIRKLHYANSSADSAANPDSPDAGANAVHDVRADASSGDIVHNVFATGVSVHTWLQSCDRVLHERSVGYQ